MADEPKKTNALQKPLTPSAELAAVVGAAQLSRGEVVSKIWEYIKKNNLQNPENKREIVADATRRAGANLATSRRTVLVTSPSAATTSPEAAKIGTATEYVPRVISSALRA